MLDSCGSLRDPHEISHLSAIRKRGERLQNGKPSQRTYYPVSFKMQVVREALTTARITTHALERRPGEASHNRPESPLTVAVAALDVSDSSSS